MRGGGPEERNQPGKAEEEGWAGDAAVVGHDWGHAADLACARRAWPVSPDRWSGQSAAGWRRRSLARTLPTRATSASGRLGGKLDRPSRQSSRGPRSAHRRPSACPSHAPAFRSRPLSVAAVADRLQRGVGDLGVAKFAGGAFGLVALAVLQFQLAVLADEDAGFPGVFRGRLPELVK